MSDEADRRVNEHTENAQVAINNALVAGTWENADQVYAVLSLTHAMLAVAAELTALRTHLEKSREYHS